MEQKYRQYGMGEDKDPVRARKKVPLVSLHPYNRSGTIDLGNMPSIEKEVDETVMKEFFDEMFGTRVIFKDPIRFNDTRVTWAKLSETVLSHSIEARQRL